MTMLDSDLLHQDEIFYKEVTLFFYGTAATWRCAEIDSAIKNTVSYKQLRTEKDSTCVRTHRGQREEQQETFYKSYLK